ncbi:MAG: glycosyltransferase family 39 protein [Bacteroidetes bacterium]|nr:glycosyltransferase family 39 protein [Bacteroidota bacterium]
MPKLSDRTLIILLILLQLAVCLPFINAFPVALDEPFSIFWAQQNLGEMVTELNKGNNSPLHFIFLNFWEKLAGISPAAVRSLSLLFSIATIPLIYNLGRKVVTKEYASLVVLIFIFSRFNHFHALEARMYSMLVFETAAVLLLVYELLFENRFRLFWFVLVNACLLYTHYLGIILVGTEVMLIAIYWKRLNRSSLLKLAVAFGIIGICFIPGLLVFLARFSGGGQSSWVPEAQFTELYGNIIRFFNNTLTFCVVAGMLFLAFLFNKQKKIPQLLRDLVNPQHGFFLLFFLIPYLGMFIYSKISSPVFLDRYLLFTTVSLYLYVGIAAARIATERFKTYLLLVVPGIMAASVHFVPDNNREPDKVAAAVHELASENTFILIAPPYYDLTFLYHYNRELFATKPGHGMPENQPIKGVYSFAELNLADSFEQIILVDDNADLVYPNNHIYADAQQWGNAAFEKTFKGGTRVVSFLKK